MSTQPLVAPKSAGNFELPKEGMVQAVIAEVKDLGLQKETYEGKEREVPKIYIRWQLAELDPKSNNEPKRIYEYFTFSLHEKSNLRKRVVQIIKKEPEETFDFLKLVGVQRNVVIEHYTNKAGKNKAKIGSILPLNAGQAKLEIVPIRKKDEAKEAPKSNAITESNPITDDDIPF